MNTAWKSATAAVAIALAPAVLLQAPALARPAAKPAPAAPNPLATADQTAALARALRLIETPEVKAGRAKAAYWWKTGLKADHVPQEAWDSFESMMDDYTFNYALKAASLDANYPSVVHVYTPPRTWQGMNVPGSRWGGDNPDNVYRIIPIDGKAHYRLDGVQTGKGPSDVSYTLVANWETSKTIKTIGNRDVPVGPDGKFSITIGPEPADGRPNHIQSKPNALFLFIRDSLGDWSQKANALKITRLDPPDAPPMTEQQMAARAAEAMVDGVPLVYWFIKSVHDQVNVMPAFFNAGGVGGLVTQRNSSTWAKLEDDDALVITLDPADASYFSLVSQNYWFITRDYANNVSTLNNGQVTRNADGTVTYVVSLKDPGVHNWINPVGVREPLLQIRVQGLPNPLPREPKVTTKLVKLAELKAALPAETAWVTPAQRAAQVAERQALVAARLSDK